MWLLLWYHDWNLKCKNTIYKSSYLLRIVHRTRNKCFRNYQICLRHLLGSCENRIQKVQITRISHSVSKCLPFSSRDRKLIFLLWDPFHEFFGLLWLPKLSFPEWLLAEGCVLKIKCEITLWVSSTRATWHDKKIPNQIASMLPTLGKGGILGIYRSLSYLQKEMLVGYWSNVKGPRSSPEKEEKFND